MPKTDGDPLGPGFERRLREELDRMQPRLASPRYMAQTRRRVAWRLAAAALAVSLVGTLSLSAYAATGSANPVVWTEHAMTVIRPNRPSPTPIASPGHRRGAPPATPSQGSGHDRTPEPSDRPEPSNKPEPSEQPEPKESPEPSDGHSGEGSGHGSGSGSSGGRDPEASSSNAHTGSD